MNISNLLRILTFVICIKLGYFAIVPFAIKQPYNDNNTPLYRYKAVDAFAQDVQIKDTVPVNTTKKLQEIQKREDALAKKEAELRALEKTINTKLQTIETTQSKVTQLLEDLKRLKDERFKHLIDVYSNMKPQQAASVLQTVDSAIAVKILAGMKGKKAGEILSFIEAQKAAQFSEALTRIQLQ